MKMISIHDETSELVDRQPGESWDAAIRRWNGLPERVSLRRAARPKAPRGRPGRPAEKFGEFYRLFEELEPGGSFRVHYFGDRGPKGFAPYPPQPEILTAYRRAEKKARELNPLATFIRFEEADHYYIKRLT